MNAIIDCWVGIDVSKSKLDVVRLDDKGKIKSHVFNNDAKGFAALIAWMTQRACTPLSTQVCTEATGPYGEALCTFLCDQGWRVSVLNPARIKGFAQSTMVRNKTDRADAALLARFAQTMKPEAWTPAPLEVRQLRALVDRLQALKDMHQQEANRLEAAANQPSMTASIKGHMQWLKDSIKELQGQIDAHIDGYPTLKEDAALITSIPGLGNTTAAKVLAYLGNVQRFKNAKALVAFVGVAPKIKESGASPRGRSVIARSGHAAVRHALYMPAMVALKYNPLMNVFAQRLKADGLAPKAVIVACMHKLLRQIYGVLKSRNAFDAHFLNNRLDFQDGI